MPETMLLIAGRTSKQGTSLNKGKLKEEYQQVTSTVEMNQDDMQRLALSDGDHVRLSNDTGQIVVTCVGRKPDDLPAGILFMAYGPNSSHLMAGDTGATGMPLSKNLIVQVEKSG